MLVGVCRYCVALDGPLAHHDCRRQHQTSNTNPYTRMAFVEAALRGCGAGGMRDEVILLPWCELHYTLQCVQMGKRGNLILQPSSPCGNSVKAPRLRTSAMDRGRAGLFYFIFNK